VDQGPDQVDHRPRVLHHAQSRTTVAGKTNAINAAGDRLDWIGEGTARWVEDEVFDSISSYQTLNTWPHPLVLVRGVASPPQWIDNDRPRQGQRHVSLRPLRLVEDGAAVVQRFRGPGSVNFDATADPQGLQNLVTGIGSTKWQCDFGAGFGDENKATFAAALLYYTYATVKEDDISRLDSNEPYFPCERPRRW